MEFYSYFIVLCLPFCVSGFNAYNSHHPFGSPLNPLTEYNSRVQNGPSIRYAEFPQTFPGHYTSPSNHQSLTDRHLAPTSGQIAEHIPYIIRPAGSKPDQPADHHFLTRPQSIIHAPYGPSYMPHLIRPQPYFTKFYTDVGQPFFQHNPLTGSFTPGITVMAKNIFIHNDYVQKVSDNKLPFGLFHFAGKPELQFLSMADLFKPEIFGQKSNLLARILSSGSTGQVDVNHKLENQFPTHLQPVDILYNKPNNNNKQFPKPLSSRWTVMRPPVSHVVAMQRPPLNMVENARPLSVEHSQHYNIKPSSIYKEISTDGKMPQTEALELGEFHPLLEPTEPLEEHESSVREPAKVTVTDMGNISVEQKQ